MDWNRVEGNWKQIKGKVKEQWGDLTDDGVAGKRDQLEGKIQERYGLEKIVFATRSTIGITAKLVSRDALPAAGSRTDGKRARARPATPSKI